MLIGSSDISRRPAGRRNVLLIAVLVACLCVASVWAIGAPAETLDSKYQRKQEELSKVKQRERSLATSLAESNRQVDALIGEVAAVRARAAAVRERLEDKQAQLDRAKAELAAEREHLRAVRARLKRALDILRRELVAIYKGEDPDTLSVILQSATWADVVAQSEYLDSIQDYTELVVTRVRELRDQTRVAVERLRAASDQLERARDAIAAKQRQVDSIRAGVEARKAELDAARAARQEMLDSLEGREQALSDNLASIADQMAAQNPAPAPSEPAPLAPGDTAKLMSNGQAAAPASAPAAVNGAIAAANAISDTPYAWGGGHGSFESSGYDCSGAVSYALHGGGLLSSPLDSTGLSTWGSPGAGRWITVYANSGHAYAVIAGLRWDTSGGAGPRWHSDARSSGGYIARHSSGL